MEMMPNMRKSGFAERRNGVAQLADQSKRWIGPNRLFHKAVERVYVQDGVSVVIFSRMYFGALEADRLQSLAQSTLNGVGDLRIDVMSEAVDGHPSL
jgi:hypothetical protein